jgi:quinolinate synthase
MSKTYIEQIYRLKKETDTTILAHYYEDGEIQDLADVVGDSLYLAQKGENLTSKNILLAGVVFMAESVKLLNPKARVLVPDLAAGCSLVNSSPYQDYLAWRLAHPDAICVSYINSSVAVKAISDVICTSSNAKKVIEAIPQDRRILFGPDKNLGRYLMRVTGRKMILWNGACEVHELFSAKRLVQLIHAHPDALVIAHPECDETVLAYATVVGSTSKLLETVKTHPAKKFIVATETGIFHQMKKVRPEAELIQAPTENESCQCNNCPYMKMNTLEKIIKAMQSLSPEVQVPEAIRPLAKLALKRMLQITKGEPVEWPEIFRYQDGLINSQFSV